jgi:lysophospholipase L1-like esterase
LTVPNLARTLAQIVLAVAAAAVFPKPANAANLIAAFGDSITVGTTASVSCKFTVLTPVYACPNGTDYLSVAAQILDRYEPTAYQNLSFRGASTVSVPLYQVPFLSPAATAVVLYVGSGDRLRVADNTEYTLSQWKQDFDWMVAAVHQQAPHARVILVALPNSAYVPAYSRGPDARQYFSPERRRQVSEAVLAMDAYINAHGEDVLDLLCSPDLYEDKTLEGGLWYPNDAGFADIGKRIAEIVRSKTTVKGSSSCPPYTVTP